MAEKVLMKGNEALAEAAIQAGCHHFFGYPITPQTELAAYMAKRMPKIGGTYLQAESEIAAVNMVLGAAAAGVRAMTSSSSPGISLKGEGISYMAGSDLPALIINVQRGGPGLGGIQPSQSDYWQATKALGHGDFQILVFAPSTVQEMVDLVSDAFDKADEYRSTKTESFPKSRGQPAAMKIKESTTSSTPFTLRRTPLKTLCVPATSAIRSSKKKSSVRRNTARRTQMSSSSLTAHRAVWRAAP